jgi:hypothetical protein
MPKYNVLFTTHASAWVTVEAPETDDKGEIVDFAYDASTVEFPSLCAQCSGWGQQWDLELGDEWEPFEFKGEYEVVKVEE